MAGDDFVGLARLNFFISRWVCATFVSDFRFWVLLSVWLSHFFCLSGVGGGNSFLSSSRRLFRFTSDLIFCFVPRVGFARLFVGLSFYFYIELPF